LRSLLKSCTCIAVVGAALGGGCGQVPVAPATTHIRADEQSAEGSIPPPVQVAPVVPKPQPAVRPETYSVVVNRVPAQELLFALARDAKLQIDIDSGLTGSVTLNAIDQTLPQLLARIARQIDMRYELDGQTLVVQRDTPFLRVYRIDYVNLARDVRSVASLSTQITSSGAGGASGGTGGAAASNNSLSTINSVSANKFWDTLVANVKDILRETDKVLPAGTAAQPAALSTTAPAAPVQPAAPGSAPAAAPTPVAAAASEFREAASVIANAETGILNIRATGRQHEKLQEFLDQVMASAKRQVLIEATVAEVQLNNQYQRGIDWQRLRNGANAVGTQAFGTGGNGLEFNQSSANTPAGINTGAFILGGRSGSVAFAMRLLESFGDVRVLSSPKISVLNNQTAVLKVVDNLVYFTIQAQTTTSQTTALTTFTTTVNSVPVGFIMSVVPQISDSDAVVLNLRPTISRQIGNVSDPNPSLAQAGVASLIPVIQTREMESVLRVQSGQIAVLGGLMQDSNSKIEDTIPGLNQIPGLGQLLEQRKDLNQKTELVIFLRPIVIREPSIDADFASLRGLLPRSDYFSKPNPARRPAAGEPAQ